MVLKFGRYGRLALLTCLLSRKQAGDPWHDHTTSSRMYQVRLYYTNWRIIVSIPMPEFARRRTEIIRTRLIVTGLAMSGVAISCAAAAAVTSPVLTTRNESGYASTVSTRGTIDLQNPFFQDLGTNGRTCVHCHQPDAAWSITPADLRQVFDKTSGLDPVFRTNDGSNSPLMDVSTVEKRRLAYSMLLNKGVIRVGLPIPPGAEFELIAVDDPYRFASAAELSLFRRPLPGTNVRFVSAVMWDGRETLDPITNAQTLKSNLQRQALDATLGHAQASKEPTPAQLREIVEFVFGLHTTQTWDQAAGALVAAGATAGPVALMREPFFIGINDPVGMNPTGASFDPTAMRVFAAWENLTGLSNDPSDPGETQNRTAARQAVARGERIFNTRTIALSNVGGLNDTLSVPVLQGTCTTCHDTPNVGNHSVSMPLNIGISDENRRTPDMPLYTLRSKLRGRAVIKTTDPGRALISGKWADIGKFKGPTLRALAARPPYFHNGSAGTLTDVVDFYDMRFSIGFTAQEKQDLVAFLRSL
jgi:cytochrome c peroxidase